MTIESIYQFAERMVRNEVLCCMSSLVATLSAGQGAVSRRLAQDLDGLCEQAGELTIPVLDYESAAIEAGWFRGSDRFPFARKKREDELQTDDDNAPCVYADSWEEACDIDGIWPHDSEVYEHWAVSTWFAEKLAAHGEKVDTDFAGLNVWARQCTGQGIAADSVVLAIARECMSA